MEKITARFQFWDHSLGALITMDLATSTRLPLVNIIIGGIPTTFEVSKKFSEGMIAVGANETSWPSESIFSEWWKKIIPLYFKRKPAEAEIAILNSKAFWLGNEQFTDSCPTFDSLAQKFVERGLVERTYYFEINYDLVPPDGNFSKVSSLLGRYKIQIHVESWSFSDD